MHITEIHPLQLPGFDTLACVDTLQSENGNVDYIDALTVAIDVIKKRTEALIDPEKYTKNVFIISDFASQVLQILHLRKDLDFRFDLQVRILQSPYRS